MAAMRYRSYVIRAWTRDEAGEGPIVRVCIEDVRSGREIDLRGQQAVGIAAAIERAVAPGSGSDPAVDPGDPRAADPSRVGHEARPPDRGRDAEPRTRRGLVRRRDCGDPNSCERAAGTSRPRVEP